MGYARKPAGGDAVPQVMLSPNAMKRVTDICGGRVTVTGNEQLAVWLAPEPVAVQATVVVPGRNADPEAGVQAV